MPEVGLKNALARVRRAVGSDPDTEIVSLSGTGAAWMAGVGAPSSRR